MILGDRTLDDNERIYDESGTILDDETLKDTEIMIPWMIWGDRTPGDDETGTRIPFEGGKTFDERTLEDESNGICYEILVDNIHGPYPCNFEMTSISNQISCQRC